jgi:methylenetetrahydrofolate dehydrogenase (NADP+)/methenyltetrahydrofolate cyclohydrolase
LEILDGKQAYLSVKEEIKNKLINRNVSIGLAVLLVGDDSASKIYVNMKKNACKDVGIYSKVIKLSGEVSEEEVLKTIDSLNKDNDIHGILVQLPLPKHINEANILKAVSHKKDVDGFHPFNVGGLVIGEDGFVPATPLGVMKLLEIYNIPLQSKDVAIIGTSNIVGKPLASLFLNAGATVSMCNRNTKDISHYTKYADIVCVGVGLPNLIKANMVKENVIIIDVGINKVDGKIVGDVDFKEVSKKASYITPVPGGVGPMTIAMLLENTIKAFNLINGELID